MRSQRIAVKHVGGAAPSANVSHLRRRNRRFFGRFRRCRGAACRRLQQHERADRRAGDGGGGRCMAVHSDGYVRHLALRRVEPPSQCVGAQRAVFAVPRGGGDEGRQPRRARGRGGPDDGRGDADHRRCAAVPHRTRRHFAVCLLGAGPNALWRGGRPPRRRRLQPRAGRWAAVGGAARRRLADVDWCCANTPLASPRVGLRDVCDAAE